MRSVGVRRRTIGSDAWPSAWSSRCTAASPSSRASGPRATGTRSPIRSNPNRRAAANASAFNQRAETARGSRCCSALPGKADDHGIRSMACERVRRSRCVRVRDPGSEPGAGAEGHETSAEPLFAAEQVAPLVRSSQSPSGPHTSATGVQLRNVRSARRSARRASASGSAGQRSRSGASTRACVATMPVTTPDASARGQAATIS